MPRSFPFTAVVGSDDLTTALVLVAIDPSIGGVLARGEKGTAKTTTVRALAKVMPPVEIDGTRRPARLVELPVGATEDRVIGSVHLSKALSDGEIEYEPGLLAKADRGILYVDEINLLGDHLVDLLLDAAATGRTSVERDGISAEHPARFVLVGTMNPEEGELRPQLLDRFGLTVEVTAPREPTVRAQIVRRRLDFDADPAGFSTKFAEAEAALTARIDAARRQLGQVGLDDSTLTRIAEICSALDVDGMRADIVMARTAAAHAAWSGRSVITREDLEIAARLALPHRRRRNPFDEPGINEDELRELLGEDDPNPDDPNPDGDGPDGGREPSEGAANEGTGPNPEDPRPRPENSSAAPQTERAGQPDRARLFRAAGVGRGETGRRSRAITEEGRHVGSRSDVSGQIALLDSMRAALPHQHARGRRNGRLLLEPKDLRTAVREGRESNLVLLCVDSSGSMAASRRMAQVKTTVLSLLTDAYQRRDKVALVTFRDRGSDLALPPTGSIDVARRRLDELPAGGRTPLAEGLLRAAEVVRRERLRDPRRRALLVVVTDGRATSGSDALARAHRVAGQLCADGVDALVVDCETGRFTLGLARTLADHLGAQYVALGDVTAAGLTDAIRGAA